MKVKKSNIFIFLFSACLIWSGLLLAQTPSAYEVIQKGDRLLRGSTSVSRISIQIIRPRFKRKIILDSWDDKKNDRFFMRIRKPKKDKGITFLKKGRNLWQFIPKIGKEIKVEESLMGSSWMGSDFTNDDLVKQSSIVDDYIHSFMAAPKESQYRILLKPKPGVPVVWGKIIAVIRKSDYLPVTHKLYDHKGRLKKILTYSNIEKRGGRRIPTRMVMASIRNNRIKSKTILNYAKIKFDVPIRNFIFSRSNLRR